jgi:hypothetical protein
LVASINTALSDELKTLLTNRGDSAGLAWHLSSRYKHSGAFLTPAVLPFSKVLTDPAYSGALSRRLLLNVRPNSGLPFFCSSCHRAHLEDDERMDPRFHAIHCTACQGLNHLRHRHLLNTLVKLLISLYGEHCVQVEKEMFSPLFENPPPYPIDEEKGLHGRPADIMLTIGNIIYYIDVAVASPSSQRAIRAGSAVTPDTAATQREAEKRAKYAPLLAALGVHRDQFFPFVVEATGRFGPAATSFLTKLPQPDRIRAGVNVDSEVQFFKRKATAHVWLGNAFAMEACGYANAHVPRPLY